MAKTPAGGAGVGRWGCRMVERRGVEGPQEVNKRCQGASAHPAGSVPRETEYHLEQITVDLESPQQCS